jgi:hypothetical protein
MMTDVTHPTSTPTERAPLLVGEPTAAAPVTGSAAVDFSEDPGLVMTSCANCGAQMLDRKCKLICSCGYFLSCSDYY